MKPRQKLILSLMIAVTLGTVVGLYGYYGRLRERAYQARRAEVAEYIQRRAAQMIQPKDFAASDAPRQGQAFEVFFQAIQTPELFRIKVFNREPKIIWSNLKEIIGQDASSNPDLKAALESGKATLKFKSSKPEQVSERQFQEFTETYVPIRNKTGAIVGVIEVYQTAFQVEEAVKREFQKAAVTASVIVLFGCGPVVLVFLRKLPAKRESES